MSDVTDDDILKLKSQYENFQADVEEAERALAQPHPERPPLEIQPQQISDLKLNALIEFLMPHDGVGASNDTKKGYYLFQTDFLSKYRQAIDVAERQAIEIIKEMQAEQAKSKIQVASAMDMEAISRAHNPNPLFRT